MTTQYILVTGGAGFIGSHTCVELIQSGYNVLIVDDLSNSNEVVISRIRKIVQIQDDCDKLLFFKLDLATEYDKLEQIFKDHQILSILHFAGLKAVGESVKIPLSYYETNLMSSLNLFKLCVKYKVFNIIFSSTASLYGNTLSIAQNSNSSIGILENSPPNPQNPYSASKLMIETFLKDLYKTQPDVFKFGILRYFNPCGAHPSGLIGEDPNGIPQNLMPYIAKVAGGKLPQLTIFGDDYDTEDGTAIRDYIHVVDCARAHLDALKYLLNNPPQCFIFNIGTGIGTSVKQMVLAFEKVIGRPLPHVIGPRRQGDVASLVADPTLAMAKMNWKTNLTIQDMCSDLWNWQQMNPNGYNH